MWAGALLDGLDFEVAERSVEVQKELYRAVNYNTQYRNYGIDEKLY